MSEKTIDVRGQECPKPVLAAREALGEDGLSRLTVIVDNEPASENVRRLAKNVGWQAAVEPAGDDLHVILTGGEPVPAARAAAASAGAVAQGGAGGNVVALVPSEFLGSGDDELGAILMRAFIKTLREVDPLPSTVIFINSGVKLTSEGSELIDDIRELERLGSTVLACGTCLDFFGLKEKLEVGCVSNMFEIASALVSAGHIVRV